MKLRVLIKKKYEDFLQDDEKYFLKSLVVVGNSNKFGPKYCTKKELTMDEEEKLLKIIAKARIRKKNNLLPKNYC